MIANLPWIVSGVEKGDYSLSTKKKLPELAADSLEAIGEKEKSIACNKVHLPLLKSDTPATPKSPYCSFNASAGLALAALND